MERALIVAFSPDPCYESGLLRRVHKFRRAKFEWILLLFLAHWGLLPSKFVRIDTLTHTAWCVPTCLVRRGSVSAQAIAQLPQLCQWRRCHISAQFRHILYTKGPVARRQEEYVTQILPAG